VLSGVTTSLLVYVVKLFIFYVAVYQINNLMTQTSREVVTALSRKDGPLEDGQTIVTETCRVLMMCFTNIFKN
jgi:hypothetical protein